MVNDTIGDAITRIRNAYRAGKESAILPYSRVSESVSRLLAEQGYLSSVDIALRKTKRGGSLKEVVVALAYRDQLPLLTSITRVSKPGRRIQVSANRLPRVLDGYGTAVVSTSQGLMTDKEARKKHIGGEILLTVY